MELKTYFAQDAAGNIISSAIVNVFLHGTTTLATGLTRADGTPLENPFAADGAGRIQFRAPDGYYDVQVSAGPGIIQTLTIQCVDYSGAKADADRAEAAADLADVSAEQAQNALNSIAGINDNFEQNSREQWRRSLAEAGLTLVSGSFEEGATANSSTDAVWHIAGGQCYTWNGTLPKSVPADSTPTSTGGVGPGAWVSVSIKSLRSQLETANSGIDVDPTNVTHTQGGAGTVQLPLNAFLDQHILAESYGIVGDGVTDDLAAIIKAITETSSRKQVLYFKRKTYLVSDFFWSTNNTRIYCEPGAVFKLSQATTIGGFFLSGSQRINGALQTILSQDVETWNMTFDCNGIAGENGVCGTMCSNIKHHNVVVMNTLYSAVKKGGRAFQFEGATAQDINIYGPQIMNCSIGINSQGAPDGSKMARAINYFDVSMLNVDIPFNVDSGFTSPETNTPLTMSTNVYGASLRNCGKITGGYGTATTNPHLGAGIVCGDRGFGLNIRGLRVINDATYGAIGAILRGQMFGVSVEGLDFYGSYASRVIDHTPVGFGTPSQQSLPSTVYVQGKVKCNLDYVMTAHSSLAVSASRIRLDIDIPTATPAALFDANAGASTLAMMEITNTATGYSTGLRKLSDLYNAGNNDAIISGYDGAGTWTPADSSGAGLTLTTIGSGQRYERNRNVVTAVMNITFPTTADTSTAVISGLPFTSAATGGGTLSGGGKIMFSNATTLGQIAVRPGTTNVVFYTSAGVAIKNSDLSGKTLSLLIEYIAA